VYDGERRLAVTEQVSFEDIKQLFRETDRKWQETERRTAEARAETDRRLAEARAESERRQAEARAESERRQQETDRRLERMNKQYGDLGNRLGEFVEGMVRPGLVRMFRGFGLDVRETQRDVDAARDGVAVQIDLLVVNETDMVAVEVKSKLTIERVDEHLERMAKFKRAFPRYRENRVLAAVAAMVIPEEVARYAEASGLFVIGQAGDDAVLLNAAEFQPRAW
jgi:hypothetical protein